MEEITATVGQNAENARQASRLSSEASRAVSESGEVMGQVVDTMGRITASSEKMAVIIGTIDSIAFQTNILALNASVEAARAPASTAVASRWWPRKCVTWPAAPRDAAKEIRDPDRRFRPRNRKRRGTGAAARKRRSNPWSPR